MKKITALNCICMACKWIWVVVAVNPDRKEQCPECKSFDVNSFVRRSKPSP